MPLSVSCKYVAGVYLVPDIGQVGGGAVCEDGMREAFELAQVVYNARAEERGAVLKRRLIDYHGGPLCLDALHDSLDGGLTEVVGVALHGEAVDSDDALLLGASAVGVGCAVAVVACLPEHTVGYEVLAGAVALNYRADEVLRNVRVVGEKLLGILGQTVAAVAERRVVVVVADAGVKSYAIYYCT